MLFKGDRLRCSICGRFVIEPKGIPSGQNIETKCSLGHSLIYRSPTIYYVQGMRDPITGIVGDDSNDGLSVSKPLKTISEAIKRCSPYDIVSVGVQ